MVPVLNKIASLSGGSAMNQKEFSEYTRAQIEEIERHKWIESEKAGRDLGQSACLEWIRLYAAKFRAKWQKTHFSGEDRKKDLTSGTEEG